jgi:hypothetical protein
MRYFVMILLVIFSLSFITACGQSPEGKVNYNELKDTPQNEPPEPGPDVKQAPQ